MTHESLGILYVTAQSYAFWWGMRQIKVTWDSHWWIVPVLGYSAKDPTGGWQRSNSSRSLTRGLGGRNYT